MSDKEVGRDKMLDQMLDSALAEYSQVEPRPGLENRILAGLANDERAVKWDWKWILAFAAACIVIALLVAPREKKGLVEIGTKTPDARTPGNSNSPAVITSGRDPGPRGNLVSNLRHRQGASHQNAQPRAAVPHDSALKQPVVAVVKQPVFPEPSPLSEQEKLLFAYLRKTPYQELVQNSKPDEPKVESEFNQVMPGQEKSSNRDTNSR
jgi:hypothetical protein